MRRSSRCSTALGQSTESRASTMNVSICHERENAVGSLGHQLCSQPGLSLHCADFPALVQGALLRAGNAAQAARGLQLQLAQVCAVLQVTAKPWGHCTPWPGAVGMHSPTAAQAPQRK